MKDFSKRGFILMTRFLGFRIDTYSLMRKALVGMQDGILPRVIFAYTNHTIEEL